MPLGDIAVIISIIAGLVSIPFLVSGPLSDSVPTGKLVLNMDASEVESTPSKMTKIFSSEKFEKTYETAFGKFKMTISGGEVSQELSKTGKVTSVNQNTETTTWKITTQQYKFEVIRTPDSVAQTCTTPDGEMKKIKERGEVTESFQGMNQEYVMDVCEQAEQDLQGEVEKIQQIVEESEIPLTETKTERTKILINEFVSDPETTSHEEWIEFYNPGEKDVNLTGWTFEVKSGTKKDLSENIIKSGEYFVVNGTYYKYSLVNSGDIIILRDHGDIVDQVTYGSYHDGNIDDNAPKPVKGNSTARIPNGADTNNDGEDFRISPLTPGASNN